MTIEELERCLHTVLEGLRHEIRAETYSPGPGRLVRFRSPKGDREREILHLNMKEKWLHRVTHDYLSDRIDPFLADSCTAYRKNMGTALALERVREWLRKGKTCCFRTDIADYYPSICLSTLHLRLQQVLDGHPVLSLTRLLITAPVIDERDRQVSVRGLPLGLPLSPLFANLYLAPVDHWMEELTSCYVRFGDDILVLGDSMPELEALHSRLSAALNALGLSLKEAKTRFGVTEEGFTFLGSFIKGGEVYQKKSGKEAQPGDREKSIKRVQDEAPRAGLTARHRQALSHALGEVSTCGDLTSVLAEELLEIRENGPEKEMEGSVLSCGHRVFLRTLYLTEAGFSARIHNENIVIKGPETEESIPLRKVHQVVVLGRVHLTTPLLMTCLRQGVPVIFLSHRGNYSGRLESMKSLSGTLAYEQWKRAESLPFRLAMAETVVAGKLQSYIGLLKSRREKDAGFMGKLAVLEKILKEPRGFSSIDEVLGHEGHITRLYYNAYGSLFKGDLQFQGRNRRPPRDPVNALLSFGYTLLYNDIRAVIAAHGLDDRIGFFHVSHSGRPALAMDLIEELRAPIVDRMVLRLANQKVLGRNDFDIPTEPEKGCYLKGDSRKRFIEEYEKTMRTPFFHASTGLKLDARRVISVQVICLKRIIQGKLERYIPAALS